MPRVVYGIGGRIPGLANTASVALAFPALAPENIVEYDPSAPEPAGAVLPVLSDDWRLPLKKTQDQSNATTTLADVTELQRDLAAGQPYAVEWLLHFHSAAATTGFQFAVVPTANPTRFAFTVEYQTSATAWATFTQTTPAGIMSVTSAAYVANAAIVCRVAGIVTPSVAGPIKLQFRSEIAGSAITVRAGSKITVV